jgi:hypothetical protein
MPTVEEAMIAELVGSEFIGADALLLSDGTEAKVGLAVKVKSRVSFGSVKMGDVITGKIVTVRDAGPGSTSCYVKLDDGSSQSFNASELSSAAVGVPNPMAQKPATPATPATPAAPAPAGVSVAESIRARIPMADLDAFQQDLMKDFSVEFSTSASPADQKKMALRNLESQLKFLSKSAKFMLKYAKPEEKAALSAKLQDPEQKALVEKYSKDLEEVFASGASGASGASDRVTYTVYLDDIGPAPSPSTYANILLPSRSRTASKVSMLEMTKLVSKHIR